MIDGNTTGAGIEFASGRMTPRGWGKLGTLCQAASSVEADPESSALRNQPETARSRQAESPKNHKEL